MRTEIGNIEAIFRYPVKSMRGEPLDTAILGWHGIEGDRRLALHRVGEPGGFPWLTANKFPELVVFSPRRRETEDSDGPSTHVLTPEGEELPIFGDALAADITRRCGVTVQMMQLRHGIFDDASLSVITADTVREIGRLSGTSADVRRFRPNVVIRSGSGVVFEENDWLGSVITFGEADAAPAVSVTMGDVRCAMVNIDPDRGTLTPDVLKAVVRANENIAGVYATVTRTGRLAVGQPVVLHR